MSLTRRHLFGTLVAPLAHGAGKAVAFIDYEPGFRVDVQATGPHVKSFDLRNLTSWQTPAEDFFTFHQTKPAVHTDLTQWRLEMGGAVAKPRTFTYSELGALPAREVGVTIECAGNTGHSRIMNGLVGNGVWSGPSLAPLLRECGVLAEAREVVFFGADIEQERKWPVGDREFSAPHGRSIFVQDALADGPMLALQFNGKPLPPDHGYPVRLVLPGWYGMTQVKWLNRILVLDRRYEGRHMARNYHSIQTAADGLVLETSISRNRLKSVVARVEGTAGKCRFSGAAWGGQYPIDQVQIRLDQQRWQNAAMSRTSHPHAWTLWEFDWHDAASGTHDIVSRAIDARGVIQPVRSEFISSREDNAQWPRRFVVAAAL